MPVFKHHRHSVRRLLYLRPKQIVDALATRIHSFRIVPLVEALMLFDLGQQLPIRLHLQFLLPHILRKKSLRLFIR